MPNCPRCESAFEATDLRRHTREGVVVVHCPECGAGMGSYNSRSR